MPAFIKNRTGLFLFTFTAPSLLVGGLLPAECVMLSEPFPEKLVGLRMQATGIQGKTLICGVDLSKPVQHHDVIGPLKD